MMTKNYIIIKRRKSIFKEYHRIEKDIEELENDA